MMIINLEYYIAFVLTGALIAAAPGPNLLFIVSQSLRSGFMHSVPAVAGMVFASLTYAILAVAGAAVLLETFPFLLILAKVLGAGYLTYLAIQQLRRPTITLPLGPSSLSTSSRGFGQGLLVGLSNPKTMLFYLTFIPQFLDPKLPFTEQLVVYNVSQLIVLGSVTLGYAALANSLRLSLQNPNTITLMNRIAALVLIAAACIMLVTLL